MKRGMDITYTRMNADIYIYTGYQHEGTKAM
jgi:hypothetical protein